SLIKGTSSTPITELDQPNSTGGLLTRLGNDSFGMTARIVPGYRSTASEMTGFLRGDGCLVEQALGQVGLVLQAGKGVAVAVENKVSHGIAYGGEVAGLPT